MKQKLPEGVIVSMPTPLLNFDKVDLEGLSNLIEYLISSGVAGISILGHTGEEHCLDYETRRIMISETCRIINSRVPVFVSISDTSFNESYILASYAKVCGAAAMVFSPPYYLTAGQAELKEYFEDLLRTIQLPILLYNVESPSNIKIEPSTILDLIENERIVGLKDGSADMVYLKRVAECVKEKREDFKIYCGKEEVLFETAMLGGNGGFAGGANLFPKLYTKLYAAIKKGDLEEYKKLQAVLMEVNKTIFSIGHYHSSYLKGIKCALNLMGIIKDDYMAPPFHKFNEPERFRVHEGIFNIKKKLEEYGI